MYWSRWPRGSALGGAVPVRAFLSIMRPPADGGLVTALILNAIGLWSETLPAIAFVPENAKFTLARALFLVYDAARYESEFGGSIAEVTIVVLLMLVLYIVLARRIITSLTIGAGNRPNEED